MANIINKRIVLMGGSGTGKTSVCNELEKIGYNVVQEPARYLICEFQKNNPEFLPWNNIDIFQEKVNELSFKNYDDNSYGFFDRSFIDEIGFRKYYNLNIPISFINKCNECRYDVVFEFHPWEEIFINDDVRKEKFEETLIIHDNIITGYKQYGYHPIIVPKVSVKERVEFILNNI